MKFDVVARQLPERQGTAPGRVLLATCEGLIAEGHDVRLWSWRPEAPTTELPGWCTWRPVHREAAWRRRGRAVVRPRSDVAAVSWRSRPDAIAVADDVPSFAAVRARSWSAVTLHYLTRADAAALSGPTPRRRSGLSPRQLQDVRAERTAARRAALVLAYSSRVGSLARGRARVVPAAYPVPDSPLPPVDQPVAVLLADWAWPPNRVAARRLLSLWPLLRDRVTGARLVLGGRNGNVLGLGSTPGVELVGEMADSAELLAQAALVAFPCPDTSGPKIKVLEALAHSVPVLTTPAGIEGIMLGAAASDMVVGLDGFADRLAVLLADPGARARMGAEGRAAVMASHAPRAAARARVAACRSAFPATD